MMPLNQFYEGAHPLGLPLVGLSTRREELYNVCVCVRTCVIKVTIINKWRKRRNKEKADTYECVVTIVGVFV